MTAPPPATTPPRAPRRDHVWHRPTGDVQDPWAWMADNADPEFLGYIAEENDHTAGWFATRTELVETLFDEIRSRVQETDMAVPVEYGGWWYVSTTERGLDYPVHHRGSTFHTATADLVLDENVEAVGADLFDVGALDVSPDHGHLAWSSDTTGDEHYTLRIRDLETGLDLADFVTDVANSGVAWSRDSRWLFYVRPDERERPCEVWRHRVGSDSESDTLVYREDDERFYLSLGLTRSQEWIIVHVASTTSSEVHLLSSDTPTASPRLVRTRRPDIEYLVDHWGDTFVMLTNDEAVDFRVLGADEPWSRDWNELIGHEPGRRITSVDPFADHLLIHEWAAGQPRVRIRHRDGSARIVDVGDAPHDIELSANPAWDAATFRFRTNALARPLTEWEEELSTAERTLLRRTPTPNVDLDAYESRREWVAAPDGAMIPIDIVHHRDTPLDGSAPGVVYGYGAYEVSLAPWFSVARLSLLDRGWIWALAHPRGGGEMGRQWYLDGKLADKANSFSDMAACVQHLTSTGQVHLDRIALRGGSAGGLLVGACVAQRPETYAAVVAEVPFVDVVNTMSDDSLPLTATEREEWGDPRVEPFARLMESYSPYDNTRPAAYPAMYVTAGLNDPRVGVHEPTKWVARLRDAHTGNSPILLRVETDSGHGGPTGRYAAWRDEARILAFLIANV